MLQNNLPSQSAQNLHDAFRYPSFISFFSSLGHSYFHVSILFTEENFCFCCHRQLPFVLLSCTVSSGGLTCSAFLFLLPAHLHSSVCPLPWRILHHHPGAEQTEAVGTSFLLSKESYCSCCPSVYPSVNRACPPNCGYQRQVPKSFIGFLQVGKMLQPSLLSLFEGQAHAPAVQQPTPDHSPAPLELPLLCTETQGIYRRKKAQPGCIIREPG